MIVLMFALHQAVSLKNTCSQLEKLINRKEKLLSIWQKKANLLFSERAISKYVGSKNGR
jgi:hypothetical protein